MMDEKNALRLARIKKAEVLANRQKMYNIVFSNENSKTVLEDLKTFCRFDESCFHADPRVHAVLEGRREVILRIMDHLTLTPEDFVKKYGLVELKEIKNG